MRVAALAAGFVLALVTPVTSPAAYTDSNGAVSPETQMNGGGCYPASHTGPPTEQLNLLNPEWAAIDVGTHLPPESDPVALHGTVVFAKINEGGDDPGDHDSDDQNTLIDVDAARRWLLAGPPALRPARHPHRRLDHARRRRGRRPLRRHPSGRLAPAGHDRVLPTLRAARGRECERFRLRRPAATAPGRRH